MFISYLLNRNIYTNIYLLDHDKFSQQEIVYLDELVAGILSLCNANSSCLFVATKMDFIIHFKFMVLQSPRVTTKCNQLITKFNAHSLIDYIPSSLFANKKSNYCIKKKI